MSQSDAYDRIRRIVRTVVAALPGGGLAAEAVDQVAAFLDRRRAWRDLAAALTQAEAAFRREARQRGWDYLADALLQLPERDRPAFQEALKAALEGGDLTPLKAHLQASLADLPGVDDPALAAQAARLYAAQVLDALWGVTAFRDAARDLALRGQTAALSRLEAQMARLHAQLDAWAVQVAEQVSAALTPALETLPERTAEAVAARLGAATPSPPRPDPAAMLRVLAVLAAPVAPPPDRPDAPTPAPLDLRAEWQRLRRAVEGTAAPIWLRRLTPPTRDALRRALSPRAQRQGRFPHILHFSGHAWKEGLLLEDEAGRANRTSVDDLLLLLALPQPIDLVVLNACDTAAEARSVAQALVEAGLARAVVGHPRPVADEEAIAFARTLYADLTDGYPLREAVARAAQHLSTHESLLLGDGDLTFAEHLGTGQPWVEDGLPAPQLRRGERPGPGRFCGPRAGTGAPGRGPGPAPGYGGHLRHPRPGQEPPGPGGGPP
jgi:Uncharacterized protein conserved in bacteria